MGSSTPAPPPRLRYSSSHYTKSRLWYSSSHYTKWDRHNAHHRISRTQAPVCPRPSARQHEKLLLRCREAVPNTDAPNLLSLWTVYFRKLPKSCMQGLLRHLSDSPPGAHSHAGVQLTLFSRGSVSQSDNTHASIYLEVSSPHSPTLLQTSWSWNYVLLWSKETWPHLRSHQWGELLTLPPTLLLQTPASLKAQSW